MQHLCGASTGWPALKFLPFRSCAERSSGDMQQGFLALGAGKQAVPSGRDENAARDCLKRLQDGHMLPASDPLRFGVGSIVDRIAADFPAAGPGPGYANMRGLAGERLGTHACLGSGAEIAAFLIDACGIGSFWF